MSAKLESYDKLVTIAFKVVMLVVILGLLGLLIYTVLRVEGWQEKATNGGISVTGIAGILKIYTKFHIADRASNNAENLDSDTIKTIVQNLSKPSS